MASPLKGRIGSSADAVVSILSAEWPLSIKSIYSRINREHGFGVTYQAVHKIVCRLIAKGVIRKIDGKCELDIKWVEKEKNRFEKISDCYGEKAISFAQLENKGTINHSLKTLTEVAHFVMDFAIDFPNPENKKTVFHWWTLYPPFSLSNTEYQRMKLSIAVNDIYILCHSETPLNKSFKEEYEKMGAKVKLGMDAPFNPDTWVRGDYVCYLYFPADFRLKWDKYCNSKSTLKLDFDKILRHLYDTRAKFNLVLTKNATVADMIREQTLKQFK
ncbi:MAG: hypothetical protein NTZ73_00170 [Candidatus Diapherotrites archaeon]|nr:hypothetical protein [Candidatus Diapherotrites archaeon]